MSGPIPDPATDVHLAEGLHVAMCVAADGRAWPWLLMREDGPPNGCSQSCCAPHEQLAPLPLEVLARLGDPRVVEDAGHVWPVCGAPTRKGRPCRNGVPQLGEVCPIHQVAER